MILENFNIQPKASILGTYSRLNYKAWYAIGEFVDNSTASYLGHKNIFKFHKIKKLIITIDYDSYDNTLTITDDAYGMDLADFKRAILLDSKPDNLNGRNEFGMGLKTAASWFGNVWSVESTRLSDKHKYKAVVDINKLKQEDTNFIDIYQEDANPMEHGTIIKISEITKQINTSGIKKKIKDLLSSMYRRDINSGDIEIYFNGEKLFFNPYKVLTFRNTERKRNVDFKFIFKNKEYHVDGFIGIMEKGSYPEAGFALFRFNRVIIGGYGENYKPDYIFGQAQSQISLKLFGELNVDDFPVNQAKDGFVWDDGLEEEFLKKLKVEINDYIEIAKLSKKERISEECIDDDTSKLVNDKVRNDFDGLIMDELDNELEKIKNTKIDFSDITEQYISQQKESNRIDISNEKISKTREYPIRISALNTEIFRVTRKIAGNNEWINYNEETNEITININHPFFKPFSTQPEFIAIIDSFVVSFICAINLAKMSSTKQIGEDHYILPNVLINKLNKILKAVSERE